VARKDVKPSGAWFTSWSSPACSPRIKLENSPRRMVRRETEDMAKPAEREAYVWDCKWRKCGLIAEGRWGLACSKL
ncbi:uncharacterized, partial [Tachysurus ichikawai]